MIGKWLDDSPILRAAARAGLAGALLLTGLMAQPAAAASLKLVQLSCEYRIDPLGLDTARPMLSWQMEAPERGARQSAWQVLAASDAALLKPGQADLWDSGTIRSDQSHLVQYGGAPLAARQRVWWTVRVWDEQGEPSDWAEPAWLETGLLQPEDWEAQWIAAPAPAPDPAWPLTAAERQLNPEWIWNAEATSPSQTVFFRHNFEVRSVDDVERAELVVGFDDKGTIFLNNEFVTSNRFAAAGRVVVRDVTPMLRKGRNTLAAEVTRGARPGGLMAVLRLTRKGGRAEDVQSIVSTAGPKWLTLAGAPESWNYDKKDVQDAWRTPAFSERGWKPAQAVGDYASAEADGTLSVEAPLQPAPLLRKSFRLDEGIVRARAYVCGLGYYELYANGERIGDHVLDPGQTDYEKRVFYVTYDLTGTLKAGANAVGLMLGDGWYNQSTTWGGGMVYGWPRAIAQIEVTYADGRREVIGTDPSWTTADGPVRANNVYWGETYDARQAREGWATAAGDATATWLAAEAIDAPGGRLVSQPIPPIRRIETIQPVALLNPRPGVWIFDLGQNIAGWARLTVQQPEGTTLRLRFSEVLMPDGKALDPDSTGPSATSVVQQDNYTCKGGGETWEPRFTYHGFRYVELTGYRGTPTLENLEGVVVHSAVGQMGRFECADPLINRIHETALWTQRDNMHSLPTDCPHRERCGWLGDSHVAAEMAIYNFDMFNFYRKYLGDIETSLMGDGYPPYVAPGKRKIGKASLDWATAHAQLPWYLYLYYGDRRPIEEQYAPLVRWHKIVEEKELDANRLLSGQGWFVGIGDWCPPGGNAYMAAPVPLTSTAYAYYDFVLLARMATLLGRTGEAQHYTALAAQIRQAFNDAFLDAGFRLFLNKDTHHYDSQTADALALELGLAPDELRAAVAESLNVSVQLHADHHNTGIMGWRYLLGQLSRNGYGETALKVLRGKTYPSVGWMFELGATTLWEQWGLGTEPDGKKPGYSHNHPMQGGFDAWFYSDLAGIRPDPAQPGFKHVLLTPTPIQGLEWARAEHRSPYGTILSGWRWQGERLVYECSVPANTAATLTLPGGDPSRINEGGRMLKQAAGITQIETQDGQTRMRLASGQYRFEIRP